MTEVSYREWPIFGINSTTIVPVMVWIDDVQDGYHDGSRHLTEDPKGHQIVDRHVFGEGRYLYRAFTGPLADIGFKRAKDQAAPWWKRITG